MAKAYPIVVKGLH